MTGYEWIRIRPSGGGGEVGLLKICDYSMSYSGTDRIAHDDFNDITPDEGFVLPWVPDSSKTYRIICLDEQVTGSLDVNSTEPETDNIGSVGCNMIGYVRFNKVGGGYEDVQVGSFSGGSGINSGVITAGCGTSGMIDYEIETIESRLVVPEILAGITAPDTTVSRSVSISGELWLVVY